MSHIQQLPSYLLDLILQYVPKQDWAESRLVCLKWYPIFTKRLFKKVNITCNSRLEALLRFNAMAFSRLVPVGSFIKGIELHYNNHQGGTKILYQHFEQLVRSCPQVETLYVSSLVFSSCISAYLLLMDDHINWSLRTIRAGYFNCLTLDHYYKYKDSITAMHEPFDAKDLQFIRHFPLLEELMMPTYLPMTALQDFLLIFDVCAKLSKLNATINMDDGLITMVPQDSYPSLTHISIKSQNSYIPRVMVNYITARCVNLYSIILTLMSPDIHNGLNETYNQLLGFLFRQTKPTCSLRLEFNRDAGVGAQEVDDMICECLNSTFRPRSIKVHNSLKIIERASSFNSTTFTTTLEKQDNRTQCEVRMHVSYFDKGCRSDQYMKSSPVYVDTLSIDCIYRDSNFPEDIFLFIAKCRRLQKLTLCNNNLYSFHGYVYKTIRSLHIYDTGVSVGFFRRLPNSCPNLKKMCLTNISVLHEESGEVGGTIEMPGITLQELSMDMGAKGKWLTYVTTHKGCSCFLVEPDKRPNELTHTEADMLNGEIALKNQYHIWCHDILQFELNNYNCVINK
ncbi:hypothetical protein BCV72DRAFT_60621 [Rhizopus microsporus var. microsporus]|uniref:F-box domain-containing protein n=1 Tax=Rhizopus microsporus var. microsporus TaxID=86635 RepID=A0A1X0QQI0_RHIZD|nr:hypothetical protein BCV72DRAFT_60621 [Rhizopus microsporus var. microsporus]